MGASILMLIWQIRVASVIGREHYRRPPNGLPISRAAVENDTTVSIPEAYKKATISLDAQRRRLHGLVGPPSDPAFNLRAYSAFSKCNSRATMAWCCMCFV